MTHQRPVAALRGSKLALLGGSCLAGFVALAWIVHGAGPLAGDLRITRAFQSLHGPWIDTPLGILSAIGFPPVVGLLYGAIIVAVFVAGARREAWIATVATLGAAGLHRVAADLVLRARPSADLIAVAHPLPVRSSFPSGHVQNATAFLGFLCYLLLTRASPSRRRTILLSILIAIIAGMGAARIYFGEHWATDVLGGYLLGAAWLCVVIALDRWAERRARRLRAVPAAAEHGPVASMSKPRAQLTRGSHRALLADD